MNYKGHLTVGLITAVGCFLFVKSILNYEFAGTELFILLAIGISFPLLADIDHRLSIIVKYFLIGSALSVSLGYLFSTDFLIYGIILLDITVICACFMPHRGPTHSIQASLLSPLLLYPILGWKWHPLYLCAFAVYWSHLWADGIPFKTTMKGAVKKGDKK